jgi:hypothetical protein
MSWDTIRLQNTIQVCSRYSSVIDYSLGDRAQFIPRGDVDLLGYPD